MPRECRSDHFRCHQERSRFIADDIAYTVVRIARSEIVKDVMDFSAALCAADGQMVAQAKTIAQHLGAIPEAMDAVLSKFGDDLHDGDVVIMNDPYHGGMHLPDMFMFVPIFQTDSGVALRGRDLPSHRCRRTRAGFERLGFDGNLSGGLEDSAAQALQPRRTEYDAGDAASRSMFVVPDRVMGRSFRAIRRVASRQEGARPAVRSATAPRSLNPTCRNCSIMPSGARAKR